MTRPKEFYYTKEEMVKDLLAITPIGENDSVLDAGSGSNKVWYNNIKQKEKYECEIEEGKDFFEWNLEVDWVVGNPPFQLGWKFLEKASSIARKGIAFLGSIKFLNSMVVPNRLETLKQRGFSLKRVHILQDKRWFGRYFYLILTKEENNFLSWTLKVY